MTQCLIRPPGRPTASRQQLATRIAQLTGLFFCVGLASCTTYQPQPLSQDDALIAALADLNIPAANHQGAHGFDLGNGLDLIEVSTLAVLNSPQLKAQRSRLKVAGAQVFAAGLLPDPAFSASRDRPVESAPDLVNGYTLDLGLDLVPLIDRRARLEAQQQARKQVRLDLLWQEWQVISQARTLAVRLALENRRLDLLRHMRDSYQQRYDHSSQALSKGDITLDINGTDLTALVDVMSQINQLEQTHNETQHSFSLLLGLDPGLKLPLAPLPPLEWLDEKSVEPLLDRLPRVRPDLLALQAGYASQEARVRAAVLDQFPALGVGVNVARDTSAIKTHGLSVSLNLPLFSGNRGNIAIERATRSQLKLEYQDRLAAAHTDVDRLLQLQDILRRQASGLKTRLPVLEDLVNRAHHAYQQGDIDALTFLNMESTWVSKRLEQISLEQAGWETRIALETLLAIPEATGTMAGDSQPRTNQNP